LKIYKLSIRKEGLSHIPEKEQILFLQIGVMLNEIQILYKVTYFCNKKGLTEIEAKGQITQSFFFHSILVGKLWECWEVLRKTFFSGTLSKEYAQILSSDGNVSINKLKKYFGRNQWMSKVRNKISFHHDQTEIQKQIKLMPDDKLLEIYLGEAQGNSLHYGSSILHLAGVLGWIDESDEKGAIGRYLSETQSVAGDFLEFLNHLLVALTKKYLNLKFEENEIPDPPSCGELYLPFFVSR
jgi:hypothetical protein